MNQETNETQKSEFSPEARLQAIRENDRQWARLINEEDEDRTQWSITHDEELTEEVPQVLVTADEETALS